jgi:hypothetical protein
MTTARIHQLADDPEALEVLYRQDPGAFARSLPEAAQAAPQSLLLRAWRARLEAPASRISAIHGRGLLLAFGLALATGLAVRLPALLLTDDWYYPRFAPSIVLLALSLYFWLGNRDTRRATIGLVVAGVAAVYVSLLPSYEHDSVAMALIHLPIVIAAVLGLTFTGAAWRETEARIRFVRYLGELVILTALVGLGGIVFSGVTIALFEALSNNIGEAYMENVGLVGAMGVPVAATYLYDAVFQRRTGIPSVLARVFAPLFLVMATIYLGAALLGGQNPFVDRNFLITCNGLLLVVLAITVFSIVERDADSPTSGADTINLALAGVTLVINAIALAAIVFRLASFGFTPNRVAVLGANLVIMGHLGRICWQYLGVVRGNRPFAAVRDAITGYLPTYAAWAAVVTFVLPVIFRFG